MTTAASDASSTVRRRDRVWTIDAVRLRLGSTTEVETAGAILGIGRSKSYATNDSAKFRGSVGFGFGDEPR